MLLAGDSTTGRCRSVAGLEQLRGRGVPIQLRPSGTSQRLNVVAPLVFLRIGLARSQQCNAVTVESRLLRRTMRIRTSIARFEAKSHSGVRHPPGPTTAHESHVVRTESGRSIRAWQMPLPRHSNRRALPRAGRESAPPARAGLVPGVAPEGSYRQPGLPEPSVACSPTGCHRQHASGPPVRRSGSRTRAAPTRPLGARPAPAPGHNGWPERQLVPRTDPAKIVHSRRRRWRRSKSRNLFLVAPAPPAADTA